MELDINQGIEKLELGFLIEAMKKWADLTGKYFEAKKLAQKINIAMVTNLSNKATSKLIRDCILEKELNTALVGLLKDMGVKRSPLGSYEDLMEALMVAQISIKYRGIAGESRGCK